MVCFETKNPNLGKFWRAFERKKLVYSVVIWIILGPFGLFYERKLIKWHFGIPMYIPLFWFIK
jgi:hypothetical protein